MLDSFKSTLKIFNSPTNYHFPHSAQESPQLSDPDHSYRHIPGISRQHWMQTYAGLVVQHALTTC